VPSRSVNAAGTAGAQRHSSRPAFSPDGTKVAFASDAVDLGPRVHGIYDDLFIRDLVAGTTSLVSVRNDGEPGWSTWRTSAVNSPPSPVSSTPSERARSTSSSAQSRMAGSCPPAECDKDPTRPSRSSMTAAASPQSSQKKLRTWKS
jgi:hypothetical protein